MSVDVRYSKLSNKERARLDELLKRLKEKGGRWSSKRLKDLYKKMYDDKCYYCKIPESKIVSVWGLIYPRKKGEGTTSTRTKLELEHKDNDKTNNKWDNLSLACPICNIAKSDKFKEKEFREIGKVINKIWEEREKKHSQAERGI